LSHLVYVYVCMSLCVCVCVCVCVVSDAVAVKYNSCYAQPATSASIKRCNKTYHMEKELTARTSDDVCRYDLWLADLYMRCSDVSELSMTPRRHTCVVPYTQFASIIIRKFTMLHRCNIPVYLQNSGSNYYRRNDVTVTLCLTPSFPIRCCCLLL